MIRLLFGIIDTLIGSVFLWLMAILLIIFILPFILFILGYLGITLLTGTNKVVRCSCGELTVVSRDVEGNKDICTSCLVKHK